MKALKAGIIGCGGIAKYHRDAYEKNGVEVVAFADPNEDAARKLAEGRGRIHHDYHALLASGEVDVVSICTPPAFHETPAIAALEKGVSVLCEKPLAHTLEAARRMADAADASDAVLMCAFRHRFVAAMQVLRGLLEQIAPVVIFQNTFCGPNFEIASKWFSHPEISGGGCLPDTAAHSIDLFRYLIGEIRTSQATAATHLPGLEVEDAAVLVVKSEAGAIGSLVSTWVAGTGAAFVDVIGQNGRLIFDYLAPEAVRLKRRGDTDWILHPVAPSNGFAEQTAHFLRAVRGEEPLLCTARDGVRVAEILNHARVQSL